MEILFGIVFTKFIVDFGEELATFGYVVYFFLGKFKLISRMFELANGSKILLLSEQSQ